MEDSVLQHLYLVWKEELPFLSLSHTPFVFPSPASLFFPCHFLSPPSLLPAPSLPTFPICGSSPFPYYTHTCTLPCAPLPDDADLMMDSLGGDDRREANGGRRGGDDDGWSFRREAMMKPGADDGVRVTRQAKPG